MTYQNHATHMKPGKKKPLVHSSFTSANDPPKSISAMLAEERAELAKQYARCLIGAVQGQTLGVNDGFMADLFHLSKELDRADNLDLDLSRARQFSAATRRHRRAAAELTEYEQAPEDGKRLRAAYEAAGAEVSAAMGRERVAEVAWDRWRRRGTELSQLAYSHKQSRQEAVEMGGRIEFEMADDLISDGEDLQ